MALPSVQDCVTAFESLAPALMRAAAGSVVLLGLSSLAALLMRRASAAARHAVWLTGLAGILLLPALSTALPGWYVLPLRPDARSSAAPGSVEAVSPISAPTVSPMPSVGTQATPKATAVTANAKAAAPTVASLRAATVAPAPKRTEPSAAATNPAPSNRMPWTAWLTVCWALGSLIVVCRVLLGHLSLWWLRRRSVVVSRGELFDLLERLRAEMRLRLPVELLSSSMRIMPMTWGVWRARLLIPEQAADWPPGQRRDVLLHELGHVKRWDCLTQLVAQLACAAYWFNPMVWLACRRMEVERERACDDLVLTRGAQAPLYAKHLLASVTSVPGVRLAAAAVAMARPSTLEERVRAILDARMSRGGLTGRAALATILLLALAMVPAAVLRAQQAPGQNPPAADGSRDSTGTSPGGRARPVTTSPSTGRPGNPAPRFGGRGFGGGGGGFPAPTLGEGPSCTLDATIYDVRLPVDQIGKLDIDALAKASETADAFEKALAALGTTKPMYRANQSVRLSGDTITIGSEVPVVTNTRMTDRGQAINTIQYQSTGALFTIAGKTGTPGGTDLDLSIQVSSASDGGAPINDAVKAPIMRRATLSHKGPFQPQKPFVVLSVDASSADKDGKAVAYIGRITIGEPHGPAAK